MKIVVSPKNLIAAVNRTFPNKDSVLELRAGIDCTVSGFGTEACSRFRTSETLPGAYSVDSGSVFVNARALSSALRALDRSADTIIEGSTLDGIMVSQGSISSTLPGVDAPFERVAHFTGEERATAALLYRGYDVSGFRAALESAVGFTSKDELRRAMMGVFFSVPEEGPCSLIASDTHVLCALPLPARYPDCDHYGAGAFPAVSSKAPDTHGVLLPYPFVRRLQKVLAGYKSKAILTMRYARGCVDAEVIGYNGEVFVVTAIIDGDFPNWLRVIPSQNDMDRRVLATLDEGSISNVCHHLDRFAKAARNAAQSRVLLWNDTGDTLHIEGVDEAGSIALTVRSTPCQGSLAVVAVNPEYLSICLRAASGASSGTVTIETGRVLEPLTLRGPGGLVVLMPMQLPDGPCTPITDSSGVVRDRVLSGYSRQIDTLAAEVIPQAAPVPDLADIREVALMA